MTSARTCLPRRLLARASRPQLKHDGRQTETGRREDMTMRGYYDGHLSGRRLRQCYEIAPPRVKQYLEAEIRFVLQHVEPDDAVLELGCGYGRVIARLAEAARRVVGIDTSTDSLDLARQLLGTDSQCEFLEMDAVTLDFDESVFDKVVCAQNGICAFGVDQKALLQQALRVTRPGGSVLFSTYSERFWKNRLRWFEMQAAAGLVGAIDYDKTENGTIVCEDGFRTGLISPAAWRSLAASLKVDPTITEVDESSVWCEIVVEKAS
jgi:2-polyprenyl-6-hydroxyphenyl methylase/3-demethylubiquinone-9 3-methyltransferase